MTSPCSSMSFVTNFYILALVASSAAATSDFSSNTGSGLSSLRPSQHWRMTHIIDPFVGRRNVSYFTTSAGLAIIDGDVIYGTLSDLSESRVFDAIPRRESIGHRALTMGSSFSTWPNATVRYKFDSDETQDLLSGLMKTAISRWLTGAPYLKFLKEGINSKEGVDGVLTVTATRCGGCNSVMGWSPGPRWMNLEQACEGKRRACGPDEATHEIGHILGEWDGAYHSTMQLTTTIPFRTF